MEKESLIEKSDNLSDIEKAVIEVELEKKLTHELLESKEKDEFMSQATEDPSVSTTEKSTTENNRVSSKEVCNGGVACSLLKLGSLEKTVIASLFHSGLHSGTIFLWKKRCHMLFWGTTGYAVF